MEYRRCGRSGLMMPEISLGLWHNFGEVDSFDNARKIVLEAFSKGIVQFDIANNYGPPPGAAEMTFGKILKNDLFAWRDSMLITTKAGHTMWDGVYGDWASRKHLIASCDQSLRRLGVDYVDIFYSHRYDPLTPLEETAAALDYIVQSGRALYIGISKYPVDKLIEITTLLRSMRTPVVVDQLKYSMLARDPEATLFAANKQLGLGCVSFSPLAQGQLSERYLQGIPTNSRAAKEHGFLQVSEVNQNIERIHALKAIADQRGQTLSQMAIAWQLTDERISSVIIGVSNTAQLDQNIKAINNKVFTAEELQKINEITR